MSDSKKIALFVETSSTYGRQILRGIQRFNQTANAQQWTAIIEEHDVNSGVPSWVRDWTGHGVISRQLSNDFREEITSRGIAFVELTDRHDGSDFTTVRSDDVEIGSIAAEHFQERGLANFAFCGFASESWSDRRRTGFADYLKNVPNTSLHTHQMDWHLEDAQRRDAAKAALTNWLADLPKPVGLLACNDLCGKQVIECCQQASINVPEQVAILGVDNDELLCSWCNPPLSSVIPNAELVGFKAAELLAQMMEQPSSKTEPNEHLIAPLGIFSRQSSNIVAVEDEDLAAVLRFIRAKACDGIAVSDVLSHCEMSRSTIDRKMRDFLGRTTQQEILRVRLQKICRMLAEHDLPIETIARECGYEHAEYLHVVFKREMGMTPGEFRDRLE